MKTNTRWKALGIFLVAGAMALSAAPAFAAPGDGGAYTCTGGDIPSGNYSSLTVSGPCSVPLGAEITVIGDVTVTDGAMLDAQSAPSTITIIGNVTAGSGSFLGLGCQPPSLVGNSAHPCTVDPEGHSVISVEGNVTASGAAVVMLNGIAVFRNVTVSGGGSDEIPWTIKNSTIGRNLTMSGQTTNWLGVMFNNVNRNVTLSNITLTDVHDGVPGPGVYIVENTVGRNLSCTGLEPGVSGGFIPGEVNHVGRNATGQCAALV